MNPGQVGWDRRRDEKWKSAHAMADPKAVAKVRALDSEGNSRRREGGRTSWMERAGESGDRPKTSMANEGRLGFSWTFAGAWSAVVEEQSD